MYTVPQEPVRRWYQHPALRYGLLGAVVTLGAGLLVRRYAFSSLALDVAGIIEHSGLKGPPPFGLSPRGVWYGLVLGISQVVLVWRLRWWMKGLWFISVTLATSAATFMAYATLHVNWNALTLGSARWAWQVGLKAALLPGVIMWVVQWYLLRRYHPAERNWLVAGIALGWTILWLMLTLQEYAYYHTIAPADLRGPAYTSP